MHEQLIVSTSERLERANRLEAVADSAVLEYQDKQVDTRTGGSLVDHAGRTAGNLWAFASDLLHPLNRVVAKLHDLADRAFNTKSDKYREDRSEAALGVLARAIGEMNLAEEESMYLYSQLSDLIRVEIASGDHRRWVASEAKQGVDGDVLPDTMVDMISNRYQGDIPSGVWRTTEPYLDFKHMYDRLSSANIEAFISKAAELVDNMENPSSERESALIQDVLEAESFYAPILEVLGLDGLASVLRSYAHQIRLVKFEEASDREGRVRGPDSWIDGRDCIKIAEEKIRAIESIGIENISRYIFGDDHSLAEPVVGEDWRGKVPVQIGNLLVDWQGSKIDIGHYRLKTIGSLANKLYQKNGTMSMDIAGMTVVSDDIDNSAQAFAAFIAKRLDDEASGLVAKKADSKKQPIYVQGSVEYVAAVRARLEDQGIDTSSRVEFVEETAEEAELRGHRTLEVAKVTFSATIDGVEVPTEVQFVTSDERQRMRIGDVAHIIFKYLKQLGDNSDETLSKVTHEQRKEIIGQAIKVLTAIHDRKRYLRPDSLGVNEGSLAGASLLRDEVESYRLAA